MYKYTKKTQEWVEIAIAKNGLFNIAGRTLKIGKMDKPLTNPSNAPLYALYDITGDQADYLSGLFDNGEHFGGDIRTPEGNMRFKLKRDGEMISSMGLVEAIIARYQNTIDPNKDLLGGLQLLEKDNKATERTPA